MDLRLRFACFCLMLADAPPPHPAFISSYGPGFSAHPPRDLVRSSPPPSVFHTPRTRPYHRSRLARFLTPRTAATVPPPPRALISFGGGGRGTRAAQAAPRAGRPGLRSGSTPQAAVGLAVGRRSCTLCALRPPPRREAAGPRSGRSGRSGGSGRRGRRAGGACRANLAPPPPQRP
jgi:hypothetical protein